MAPPNPAPRYSLQQLARMTGVQIRTLRKWLRSGAVTPTAFRGRATSYGQRHLEEIHAAKKLRGENLPLAAIRARLAGLSSADLARVAGIAPPDPPRSPDAPPASPTVPAATAAIAAPTAVPAGPPAPTYPAERWEHVVLMPGLELRVRADGAPLVRRVAQDIYDHYGARP